MLCASCDLCRSRPARRLKPRSVTQVYLNVNGPRLRDITGAETELIINVDSLKGNLISMGVTMKTLRYRMNPLQNSIVDMGSL